MNRRTILLIIGFVLTFIALPLLWRPALWDATGIPNAVGTALHELKVAEEHARFLAKLVASEPALEILVPVIGVEAREVSDTFGAPRGADRKHEGVDIFAPRGTPILSATQGIVARVGTNRLGGNIVFVLGPGGERYYYAHLDTIDSLLTEGMIVGTTTILGTVGTTGNASGTPPHLHFGIYGPGGARNPFERLR